MYWLQKGTVRCIDAEQGHDRTLLLLSDGACFGQAALLSNSRQAGCVR